MAYVTDTRPQTYRAAIIGTGFMGRVHSHAIAVAGGSVAGICGSSPERAREAAASLRAEAVYEDMAALIDAADVVHVCVPNHLHAPIALAAIAAGKHVVCEKPLSTDVDSARAMTEAAAEAGVVAAVPFVYRFHPMAREARARVAAGKLGRLTLAHGSYLQDWLLHPGDDNWRVDADKGGALRAFGDIGSHWCDLLEFVTGDRITAVSAQLSTANRRRAGRPVSTEDIVTLQFATDGGMIGSTVISQVSAGRKNRLLLEISGTEASVAFDQERPETLWVGGRAANAELMRDPESLSPAAARLAGVPAGHAQGYQDCFNGFVADTRAAITGQAPDGLPVFADGLRAARLAEAVAASARTRDWVEVPK
ncbi:Gfo/Idh/MocA family protein [Glycomyces buryatensis]|uniref:Gfo/Idh/MocA family oxidoreductase n=1 Tax=Glycomyces buryatensis TaxID=2570927 RepID=A0A4S8Q7S9_9ACTN|nr:Gfo/Idh/MocA family oxidoreductase [Glycomyces buryatensis]THV40200.1 Gfo/Idh/MocA family oxidoreductase [Glycomyces buryatensis]